MGKSGSGYTYPEIIDRRDLKSRSRIFLESFLTLVFWSGYIYLLVPLMTLVLWMFGVQMAFTELIGGRGIAELIKAIKSTSLMVIIITLVVVGWGYYNLLCFWIRGERRNSRSIICYDEDFCDLYHLDLETLQAAKEQNRLMVTLSGSYVVLHPLQASPRLIKEPDLTKSN